MRVTAFIVIALLVVGAAVAVVVLTGDDDAAGPPAAAPGQSPHGSSPPNEIETIARDLNVPWEMAFLPDGRLAVTERPGILRIFEPGGSDGEIEVDGVRHIGEGGLLGMALHPDFEENGHLYLYMTVEADGAIENRVDRFTLTNDELSDRRTILEGIPGNAIHNGGRLHFGPDGHLYITTGDAGQSDLAQDTGSLAGKILRVDENGDIPDDNPFGNEVYSFGHRNPQGLAWDDEGRLWATEHGQSGNDELNLIVAGNNYGWPVIEGDETAEGMESPIVFADGTWAPSGMTILEGSIFFVGLRGSSVYEAELAGSDVGELRTSLTGDFGRLRTIRAHDGALYIATNNTDGRGDPGGADDRILRLDPAALE